MEAAKLLLSYEMALGPVVQSRPLAERILAMEAALVALSQPRQDAPETRDHIRERVQRKMAGIESPDAIGPSFVEQPAQEAPTEADLYCVERGGDGMTCKTGCTCGKVQTAQAGELPPLPKYDVTSCGKWLYSIDTMQAYARAALASQNPVQGEVGELVQRLADCERDERHADVAEIRHWHNQYKLLCRAFAALASRQADTDWKRIALVQNAKLMAIIDGEAGFAKLCEVLDKYAAGKATQPVPDASTHECCGEPVVGAEYMGSQEMICCGNPVDAPLEPTSDYAGPDFATSIAQVQLPKAKVPLDAIGQVLEEVMQNAVGNGANSASMPDHFVAIAHFLAYPEKYFIPSKPQEGT